MPGCGHVDWMWINGAFDHVRAKFPTFFFGSCRCCSTLPSGVRSSSRLSQLPPPIGPKSCSETRWPEFHFAGPLPCCPCHGVGSHTGSAQSEKYQQLWYDCVPCFLFSRSAEEGKNFSSSKLQKVCFPSLSISSKDTCPRLGYFGEWFKITFAESTSVGASWKKTPRSR